MARAIHTHLSRRESQIMDAIYHLGEATVADVLAELPDPPAYNAVRVTLGILEDKGYVAHQRDGKRFVYTPVVPRDEAERSALEHVIQTFFDGSTPRAFSALLGISASDLSPEDLDELQAMIRQAKKETEK